ncbi:MAG: flagellin [Thermodesulfobacteriota bacterium]
MAYNVILTSNMSNSLYSLQQISKLMDTTNSRLATGKKVNSALDDPINYFASQDHLYRASDLQGRKDEMNEAIQLITAANTGVESILDLIDSAISLGNSAMTATDQASVNTLEDKFNDILTQIDQLANDSFYKGTNLLGGVTEQLTVYFNQDGSSSLTLTGQDASSTGLGLTALTADDWWDAGNSQPNETAIRASLDQLTAAKTTLRSMAQDLSLDLSTIEIRLDFTSEMITTLNNGASNLTAADTNAESATLLMLQTQQSLALNSLSIASDAYSGVLALFS